MEFPATREAALSQLQDFVEVSGKYSRDRNHVVPGHGNVSRLAAPIRHRLLTEWEVAAAPLLKYAASTVEKFTQEIYWRSYWKGWLSLRPEVWDEYRTWTGEEARAEAVKNGEGSIAVMNGFANELRETGYLHNHARMWFSAYWVHVEGLPWQLGARFFQDHLLDFDPASNTLSWRWVAGLQTPGKTYLPRRSNIEKYLHPDLLDSAGLSRLEKPAAILPEKIGKAPMTRPELPSDEYPEGDFTLWVHEEDLNPESSPLGDLKPTQIVLSGDLTGRSDGQTRWLQSALTDTAARCEKHFGVPVVRVSRLHDWMEENPGEAVLGLRPEIGPLHDSLPSSDSLYLVTRPQDRALRSLATAGFFGFWKKLQSKVASGEIDLSWP